MSAVHAPLPLDHELLEGSNTDCVFVEEMEASPTAAGEMHQSE